MGVNIMMTADDYRKERETEVERVTEKREITLSNGQKVELTYSYNRFISNNDEWFGSIDWEDVESDEDISDTMMEEVYEIENEIEQKIEMM